jgi:hypothetical protein
MRRRHPLRDNAVLEKARRHLVRLLRMAIDRCPLRPCEKVFKY